MPIINQQRALVEVGRLRMGEKRTSRNGKSYPVKGTTWRLTSRDRARLDAAAAIYGGTVREWEDQFELITTTDSIEVAVVPGQALSQYMEHWGQRHPKSHKGPNPVLCLLRCDGVTELLQDRPCVCKASGQEQCKPTTRLSVMLRRVPGVGVWRLDTRGQIAAGELIAGVELLEMLTATNRPVRARLRLDQRSSIDRETGDTHNFVVPVLDIDMTLDEALDTLNGVARPALGGGAAPVEGAEALAVASTPGFTPVGELPAAPVGSIGEQVQGAGRERQARRGAAEPIRPTGRRPRSAVEVVDVADTSTGGEPEGRGPSLGSPPGSSDGGEPTGTDPARSVAGDGDGVDSGSAAASPPSDGSPAVTARARHIAMRCKDVGIIDDEHRHAFLALLTDGRTRSGKDLDPHEFALVNTALDRLAAGTLRFVCGVDGTWRLDETDPADVGAGSDDEAYWDVDRWRSFVKDHGRTQVAALRHARAVAEQLGIDPPGGFATWTDGRISAAVRTWVENEAA